MSDPVRTEIVRALGFVRGAETQLVKTLAAHDAAKVPDPDAPPTFDYTRCVVLAQRLEPRRLAYTGVYQYSVNYEIPAPVTPDMLTHHFSYRARISYPGLASMTVAVKWLMAWHKSQTTRAQFQTHWGSPCFIGPDGSNPLKHPTYWGVFDQAETTCQGYQPHGPYFHELTDGALHQFDHEYRPNSAAGSRDGFARMWIDGKKIIDVSGAMIGVTPEGGEKPWCAADDVDALAVNDGIAFVKFGGPQTTPSEPWSFEVNGFLWWARP